jgi:hypothetical protein
MRCFGRDDVVLRWVGCDGFVVGESIGVDSRLALEFFGVGWVRIFWRSRVRFAMERWKTTTIAVRRSNFELKGTNGKVTCDRGIAGEGEDDQ